MDRHTDTPEFQSIKKITKKVAICAPSHNFVGLYYYYYYYYYKKKRFRWHYVKMTAMTPYNAKTVTKCECDAKCEQSISSQPRHVSTIGKNLLNINISSTCCHNMMNFDPVMAEIGSGVWGIPANLNGFRVLALLLHRRHSTEVNQTLYDVWPSPGLVHYTQ